MHEEDFDLEDFSSERSLCINKVQSKLQRDGYRIEKTVADQAQIQHGFDDGFMHGIQLGRACGAFYARCRQQVQSPHYERVIPQIEEILFERVLKQQSLEMDDLQSLKEVALLLNENLKADFAAFMSAVDNAEPKTE